MQRMNLVLQGGGVRGIAYVGALESLPNSINLHTVAGTSAGSIVAALLAIGRRHKEIEEVMLSLDMLTLLDADERARVDRIRQLLSPGGAEPGRLRAALRFALKFGTRPFRTVRDFQYIVDNLGAHSSDGLKAWLDRIFGEATFSDIKTEELYIVASDVSERDFEIYCKNKNPSKKLSEAVLASASIPLFFRPVLEADRVLVDGGMLSNFPSHLFERAEYPTVGLRLEGTKQRARIDAFGKFGRGLLNTMLDAHDKGRVPHAHFQQFTIDTGDVSSVEFDLTPDSKKFLLDSGRRAGSRIPWELCASSHPVLNFRDSRPYDLLSASLENARLLAETAERRDNWCEGLDERIHLDYFFEEEWGTRMVLSYSYIVKGCVPFFARRFGLTTPPEGKSFVDTLPEISSIPLPPDFTVQLIPWAANDDRKGYLVLMVPPITSDSGRRGFTLRVSIKDDHKKKLLGEGRDTFNFLTKQRAKQHHVVGVARFWCAKKIAETVGIEIVCPSTWSPADDPGESHYDSQYALCGAFSVATDIIGDVTNPFHFSRIAPPARDID